jgi:hypothetical protein
MTIPIARPSFGWAEEDAVVEVLNSNGALQNTLEPLTPLPFHLARPRCIWLSWLLGWSLGTK